MQDRSWIVYTGLLVLFWGVWGALSGMPTERYGYPDQMVYIIWAITMLIPAFFVLRRVPSSRRSRARPMAWRSG